jgi:hypothetical protein
VFADRQLVAVLVRLEDAVHENKRGGWFLEAGFGPCNGSRQPVFGSLQEAQAWVQEQVRGYLGRSAFISADQPRLKTLDTGYHSGQPWLTALAWQASHWQSHRLPQRFRTSRYLNCLAPELQ